MNARAAAIIRAARARGHRMLSEHESKRVLAAYGVPVARERLVRTLAEARAAATRIGYPVVLKACSAEAAHKSERGLVAVGLRGPGELAAALTRLRRRAGRGARGEFLVQEHVQGSREVMIGALRDPEFGPAVMFGLGGVFSEILQDVVFRLAPLREREARAMLRAIRARRILEAVRGLPAVDTGTLARCLIAVGRIALDHVAIAAIDVNPLIIRGSAPVAVDALIVLDDPAPAAP
jgi:succinyl-CoA synthetase beta subunit